MSLDTVLQTIAGLKDRAGGVARSVPGLCEALARAGCPQVLVSQSPQGIAASSLLVPDPAVVETILIRGFDWERLRFSYTPRLVPRLTEIARRRNAKVIHDHGIWLHMNRAAAATARKLRLPRVVSPRGMLDGWALDYRGVKKRLAWSAYQQRDLRSAQAFCATSRLEADGVRALGFKQPIAVIPNGIVMPSLPADARDPRRIRTVVFMSRLHAKKGLIDLVRAWERIRPQQWRLLIAGPDEDGHRGVVERAVADANLGESVELTGAVAGDRKAALLAGADIFVLPSYSENFGIVVGEALAYGIPVITTTGTPWAHVRDERCGWWTEPGAETLGKALVEAMSLTDADRRAMGERGRLMIARDYSWESIARRHIGLYRWLTGDGPPPGDILQ